MFKTALSLELGKGVLNSLDVALFQSYVAWCFGLMEDRPNALHYLKYVMKFFDIEEKKTHFDLSIAFLLNITVNCCFIVHDDQHALRFQKEALKLFHGFLGYHLETAREL